jgi:hypothetical protein
VAYGLWEQAGRPECRDQEFWFKAEQQLTDATKPASNSNPQSRTKSSPNGLTTAFELSPKPKTNDTGTAATIAATQLAATREKRTTAAARAR